MFDFPNHNLDFVFCVDGTGSMAPRIESVKEVIRKFPTNLAEEMADDGYDIESIRAKIIVFRDYRFDGENAMRISPFFKLPEEANEFERCLDGISAEGGGDGPKNGLEALYYAMKSDFNVGSRDRQYILLFTDADAYEPKVCMDAPNYHKDMVNEDELVNIWNRIVHNEAFKLRKKRSLAMFAPTNTEYKRLSSIMDRVLFIPVNFEKEEIETIIRCFIH